MTRLTVMSERLTKWKKAVFLICYFWLFIICAVNAKSQWKGSSLNEEPDYVRPVKS